MQHITLLRGINVSGQKKVKMADLRAMLEKMNYQNVQTYIQSGNVIFDDAEEDGKKIAQAVRDQLLETFGYEVKVMTRSKAYWEEVVQNNPFLVKYPTIDIKFLHVTFLSEVPNPELVKKMQTIDYGTDEYEFVGDRVYLCFPNGYGRTKLTNNTFESKLKVDATTRNWKTTLKLLELC